jgi:hypothetical protein
MDQFTPGPGVSHCGPCEYLRNSRKYLHDTSDKLFTGVNDTGDKLSLVSLLPAINYCRCRFTLVPDFHRFNDTGDNFSSVTTILGIICEFRKTSKKTCIGHSGAWRKLIHEKTGSRKSRVRLTLKGIFRKRLTLLCCRLT